MENKKMEFVEISSLRDFLALRHIRIQPEQRRFTKSFMLSYLQTRHPAVTTFRIQLGEQAIGYVMLIHAENPTQWIIERLTIGRDWQGQGHGYAIADMLVDMVYDFENSEMVIARYHPENEAARRLFQRLKFVEQDKTFRGRRISLLQFEFEEQADDEDNEDDGHIEKAGEEQTLEDRSSQI